MFELHREAGAVNLEQLLYEVDRLLLSASLHLRILVQQLLELGRVSRSVGCFVDLLNFLDYLVLVLQLKMQLAHLFLQMRSQQLAWVVSCFLGKCLLFLYCTLLLRDQNVLFLNLLELGHKGIVALLEELLVVGQDFHGLLKLGQRLFFIGQSLLQLLNLENELFHLALYLLSFTLGLLINCFLDLQFFTDICHKFLRVMQLLLGHLKLVL